MKIKEELEKHSIFLFDKEYYQIKTIRWWFNKF